MTPSQYIYLTFDCMTFQSKIDYLKEIGEDKMTLVWHGYTFDEMVKAILKVEDMEEELSNLDDTISELSQSLKHALDDSIYWKERYAEVCKDYKLLEKANESLRKKNKNLQTNYNKIDAKFDSSEISKKWEELEERRKLLSDIINSVIKYCQEEEGMI